MTRKGFRLDLLADFKSVEVEADPNQRQSKRTYEIGRAWISYFEGRMVYVEPMF